MDRAVRILIIMTVLHPIASAQSDSVKFVLPEVVIRSDARERTAASMSASITTVNAEAFANARGFSADRALRKAGLVSTRDRGGEASVKTTAVRAFGASQTTISWNGIRLNSDQYGSVDLGLIPSSAMTSATILRGSQSTAYGSGAMGGVIQIRSEERPETPGHLEVLGGSYGKRGTSVSTGPAEVGLPIRITAGYDEARDDFEYESPSADHGIMKRAGNDSRRVFGSIVGTWTINERWEVAPSLLVSDAVRHSPGPASKPEPDDARLWDRLIVAGIRSGWKGTDHASHAAVTFIDHQERYVERSALDTVDQSYDNTSFTVFFDRTVSIAQAHSISGFIELRGSSTVAAAFRPVSDRTSAAIAISSFHNVFTPGLLIAPSVRVDVYSDNEPVTSGKIAARIEAIGDDRLVIRVGGGTSFRMPTYNEKYWVPGGNKYLKPERSVTVEGGCEGVQEWAGMHRWSATMFLSEVQDQLVGWPVVNVSRSRIVGGEFMWEWNVLDRMNVRGGAALTRAESLRPALPGKQMPLIPLVTGLLGCDADIGAFRAYADVEFVSRRFTTSDNIRALSSDPFVVASIGATVRMPHVLHGMSASVLIDNVFDETYEMVKDYPMSRRSIIVSISMEMS